MSKKNHVDNYLKGPNLRYVVANKNPNKTEKFCGNIYLIKVIYLLMSLYFVQLKKNFYKGRKYRNIHLKKNMMPYPTCITPNGHSIQPDRTIVCEHSTFQLHRSPKRDKQLQKIPNYIMHLNSIILEPRFHSSKSVPFILLYPDIYVSKISTFRAAL